MVCYISRARQQTSIDSWAERVHIPCSLDQEGPKLLHQLPAHRSISQPPSTRDISTSRKMSLQVPNDEHKFFAARTEDDGRMFYRYISWPPHCDEPEDDLCRRLAGDWEPIETLRELMETLEPVIRSEERWHIGGREGKLGYAQKLLASLTKKARGSSNMISKHFTKENLSETYRTGYTLSEDLEITKAPERGMYYLDFRRQLDKHLNKSGTLTDPIATGIYTVKIRGPIGIPKGADARIAELESRLSMTENELSMTKNELFMTKNELSVTENKLSTTQEQFSAFRDQCSRDNSRLRSFLEGAYRELWPNSIPSTRPSTNG
jgi:uncharacterized coiled-coil protein SlyX